jgi:hypothetical protein
MQSRPVTLPSRVIPIREGYDRTRSRVSDGATILWVPRRNAFGGGSSTARARTDRPPVNRQTFNEFLRQMRYEVFRITLFCQNWSGPSCCGVCRSFRG